jgi:hypothetical protein
MSAANIIMSKMSYFFIGGIMKIINVLLLSLFVFSCEKELTEISNIIPTAGEVKITSELNNGQIVGFSFSHAEIITYSNSQSLIPDIIVMVQLNQLGNPMGVFLSSINLKPTFCFKYWSSSMDSSLIYFDNLLTISDTTFTDLALPIQEAQVWAINTHDDKSAKILIKNFLAYNDSTDINNITPYGEVTFQWEYQPDGGNSF